MIQPALFPSQISQVAPPIGQGAGHGVVYTKPWVVELMLDLAGYTVDQPLYKQLLVEPSAGEGSFLREVVRRLIQSAGAAGVPLQKCRECIVAFELDPHSAATARGTVRSLLEVEGVCPEDADVLAESWIRTGDYLLESQAWAGRADFVIGNPPYIRLENLSDGGSHYRKAYPTMVGRADVYVAFYEAALRQLRPGGVCGYICADRWMFNQYGAALRSYVTSEFEVQAVIPMHEADAFETDVSAYPAITIIRRAPQSRTLIATLGACVAEGDLRQLIEVFREKGSVLPAGAGWVHSWFRGSEPWPLLQPEAMNLLRRLEEHFPTLEQTGAAVGIGVATGADRVFVTKDSDLVEPERLLPLALAKDVRSGAMRWSGHYLVNPWDELGLVDLEAFPKLAAYFHRHGETLERRHVGQKAGKNWYRTIDRVHVSLLQSDKLYLPDFKGRIAPVVDKGMTYPHHNLYFVLPGDWDVEVLGGLLLASVAQFFIEAYGVRMRGGYLRFQAQYLRRLRVPSPATISESAAGKLREALQTHSVALADEVALELYGLTETEAKILGIGN